MNQVAVHFPEPMVVRTKAFSMQVCVPGHWTDEQITAYANAARLSGTAMGWTVRRKGDPALDGTPERVNCILASQRPGFIHVVLDA